MTANPKQDLLDLIGQFLSGSDQSMQIVGKIEAILVENFLDSPAFEELTEPLALYRPGCGLPYYDEKQLAEAFQGAEQYIQDLPGAG